MVCKISAEILSDFNHLLHLYNGSGLNLKSFMKQYSEYAISETAWGMFKEFKHFEQLLIHLTEAYWYYYKKKQHRKEDIMILFYILVFKLTAESYSSVFNILSRFRQTDCMNIMLYICNTRFQDYVTNICEFYYSSSCSYNNVLGPLKSNMKLLKKLGNELSCKLYDVTKEDIPEPCIENSNVWNGPETVGEDGDWIVAKEVVVTNEETLDITNNIMETPENILEK